MNNIVPPLLATRAATFYARGKWGDVTLDEAIPVLGIDDDQPRAYVFLVGLRAQQLDTPLIHSHIDQHIQPFSQTYKFLRYKPGELPEATLLFPSWKVMLQGFRQNHQDLLDPGNYGTIVIAAREDRHPAIMAYEGLPFTLVGTALIKELYPGAQPATPTNICIPDGEGYPHFYAKFLLPDNQVNIISLFDPVKQYVKPAMMRAERADALPRIARYQKIWDLMKSMPDAYLQKISPSYIARISSESDSKANSGPMINDVPDITWHDGCAPTAAGNILSYWDKRGYPNLVDDEAGKTEDDMVDQLAAAMHTDSSGSTLDSNVSGGLVYVCNTADKWSFSVDGPTGLGAWGQIQEEIKANRPCHLILHGHITYGDHSVTVVGYREVEKNCAADDRFVTIHDTWPTTGKDVEIPYGGNLIFDPDWLVITIHP